VRPDEQLRLDFEVEQTAWGKWVSPERRAAQASKFMEHAGIVGLPAQPWESDSPEVVRLDALLTELFPDEEALEKPENLETIDAFVCFLGECYIKYARAEWFDLALNGGVHPFYRDVNPALRWVGEDDEDEVFTAWALMRTVVRHAEFGDGFSLLTDQMRDEFERVSGTSRR